MTWWPVAKAGLAAAALAAFGWLFFTFGKHWERVRIADVQVADARASAATTIRRVEQVQENRNAIETDLGRARERAAAAADAGQRLRDEADRFRRAYTDAAAGSASAVAAAQLWEQLHRESDEAAGVAVRALEASRIAGFGCERHADALSAPPTR